MDKLQKLKEAINVAKTAAQIIEEDASSVMDEIQTANKPGWVCPKCGSEKLTITKNDKKIKCKACLECGNTFSTMEIVL